MYRSKNSYSLCTLFIFLFASITYPENAGTNFSIGPRETWVEEVTFSREIDVPTTQIKEGIFYLLVDLQINIQESIRYSHYAQKIISDAGVQEVSELSFDFDPSYQTLFIHDIGVWRKGQYHNRLDMNKIKIIQREENLERRIYDGSLSAILFLEDVKKDDIIEYSYSVKGENPIFEGRFLSSFYTRWLVPVHLFRYRCIIPKDRKIHFKNHKTELRPKIRKKSDTVEYIWENSEVPALFSDGDLPGWFNPYPWVQLSEFRNWSETVQWALKQYEVSGKLSVELKNKIAELKKYYNEPEDQLLEALRFVQDEIRYLGIEIGPNSYKPTDPGTVFKRGFGDCKDKSLLLCTILRELGIVAYPALVHSDYKDLIAEQHPSTYSFNHVVVRAQLKSTNYWLEPTLSYQRGHLKNLYFPDYRKALLIKQGVDDLISIPTSTTGYPKSEIQQQIFIREYDNPVLLKVKSIYQGYDADWMRRYFVQISRDELEKDYLNYFARLYPDIKSLKPIEIQDDELRNEIVVWEEYSISDFWTPSNEQGLKECSFYPLTLESFIVRPATTIRSMPLGIHHPKHLVETIEIDLPEDWPIENAKEVIKNNAMRYEYHRTYENKKLILNYIYQTSSDVVEVKETTEHIKNVNKILDNLGYVLYRNLEFQEEVEEYGMIQSLNWTVIILSFFFLVISIFAAVKLYRYKPGNKLVEMAEVDERLKGLNGWLILVAFNLLFEPFIYLYFFWDADSIFLLSNWNNLTSPSSEIYHSLWMPTLTFELLINIGQLVFSILLLVLFFQKKASFPRLYIIFISLDVIIVFLDNMLVDQIPSIDQEIIYEGWQDFFRVILYAAIWIPYFKLSKRVMSTFTR